MSAQVDATEKAVILISEYTDIPIAQENSANNKALQNRQTYSLDELENLLPHDLSMLTRKVNAPYASLNAEPDTVSLGEELDQLVADYKERVTELAPDPEDALTLPYVQKVEGGILIDNEILADPKTLQGAILIEMLNAQARGENPEEIINALEEVGNSYAAEDMTTDDTQNARGLYTNCDWRAVLKGGECTRKWSGGNVYYYWNGMTAAHKTEMQEAMNDWSNRTGNTIKFKYYWDQSYWHRFLTGIGYRGAIDFRTKDINANGRAAIGYNPYYFGELIIDENLSGDRLHRTTRHELGHVIGLQHEHKRWDRDNYVEVTKSGSDYDKIDKNITYSWHFLGWEKRRYSSWWGSFSYWVPVWKKYTYNIRNAYAPTPYDCSSIMQYTGMKVRRNCQGYSAGHIWSAPVLQEKFVCDKRNNAPIYPALR